MTELFERIAKFRNSRRSGIFISSIGETAYSEPPNDEACSLIADCQSAITELQRRLDKAEEMQRTGKFTEFKDRLEKAEALLRTAQACLEIECYEDTPREIAAYFRDKGKL